MVRELTLRQVGGSIGATIPKDMAERLHLTVGDPFWQWRPIRASC